MSLINPFVFTTLAMDYDLNEASTTGYINDGYTISASSEVDSNNQAWKAFDGTDSTWGSGTGRYAGGVATSLDTFTNSEHPWVVNGAWIKVSCDQRRAIGSVQLYASAGATPRPVTWRILTSDNNTDWTVPYIANSDQFGGAASTPVITFPSRIEGRYFVLQVTATNGIGDLLWLKRVVYGAPV